METKCVMVIDAELPTGLIANTAAVLSLTLGHKIKGIIGPSVKDGSGNSHVGITTTPIPILKGDSFLIKELREKLYNEEFSELFVVDFSNAAQTTKCYEEYTEKIATFSQKNLEYLGIAMEIRKRLIN